MESKSPPHRVTLIPGDGIGGECVAAAQRVVAAAGAQVEWEPVEAGGVCFRKGVASGVPKETVASIERTRVVLKGPLETPVGYGEKSANVTLRKMFELYGNIRPTRELPGVQSLFTGRKIDFVVVRENVEDLYAGIEHMQTPGVAQCLKLISRKGSEKVCRLAFELARAEGRRKVHCATKSNIMKLTEGLFKRTCEEVARDYPDIAHEHIIIDNCAHQMARWPEQFDIVVTTNMNGDIISDLAAGLTGGLGLAPSANIGNDVAMFEAVHGSAPTIAGKDIANPTAILLSAVMLLRHVGEFEPAAKIEHALCVTLEEGKALTVDLIGADHAVGTARFTDALIANLGRQSPHWEVRNHRPISLPHVDRRPDFVRAAAQMQVGVDVCVQSGELPDVLGPALAAMVEGSPLRLQAISNRGVVVYPSGGPRTDCIDHYVCRFVARTGGETTEGDVLDLLRRVGERYRWMHVEKLQTFDRTAGFTQAQGEG